MPEIAEDEPPSTQELTGYVQVGLAWVAADDDDAPVAYLLAEPVDDALHIEQVTVHPDHARRGVGRRLIDYAAEHAAAAGHSALTLTTFTDVPWNAPYYRRLGFTDIPQESIGPGLRDIRRREADLGLDRWPRISMRKVV